ncbi:MAG: glycosyltransferase family 4 protein [bacterium]|nr:glycosyltransferase family 4 protein [bacterium]
MKIISVTSIKEKGGIGFYSKQIVSHLSRFKDINLIEINNHSKIPNNYDILHVQHHYSFFGLPLPFFNKFNSYLKNTKPIIVVTIHDLITNSPIGVPKVFCVVLNYLIKKLNIKSFIEPNINHFIIHSRNQLYLLNKMGISKNKISLLPMGVPLNSIKKVNFSQIRKKWDLEGKIVFSILGFIFRRKGYEIALKALERLNDKNTVLVIAGDFNPKSTIDRDYRKNLIKYIRKCHLEEQVVITGYLSNNEFKDLVSVTDIILAPFRGNYGSPYSLSTAIGFGKPIIASDIQPVLEIQNRMNCLEIFKDGNDKDLAKKMSKLMKDTNYRKQLATRAKNYSKKYSFDKLALQHKRIYNHLLRQERLLSKNK